MKFWTSLWFKALLLVIIICLIGNMVVMHTIKNNKIWEEVPRPRRDSVLLDDGLYKYHLNFSQFLLEFPHLQHYQCSVLLAPMEETNTIQKLPLLLLAIKSHPQALERRWALRKTWAKKMVIGGYMVRPIFLMAHSDDIRQMEIVKVESKEYGDILQWDFTEGHHNLSLKERCFLEWLDHYIPKNTFIFKGDDDEFVSPDALVEYIRDHASSPYTAHGALQRHAIVFRSSKYEVSHSLFPYAKYPPFLSGGGFLFPGTSVHPLYQASLKIPVFPLDDVYFGFLALFANITLKHDSRFYVFGKAFDACRYKHAMVVHGIDSKSLISVWERVQRTACNDSTSTTVVPS